MSPRHILGIDHSQTSGAQRPAADGVEQNFHIAPIVQGNDSAGVRELIDVHKRHIHQCSKAASVACKRVRAPATVTASQQPACSHLQSSFVKPYAEDLSLPGAQTKCCKGDEVIISDTMAVEKPVQQSNVAELHLFRQELPTAADSSQQPDIKSAAAPEAGGKEHGCHRDSTLSNWRGQLQGWHATDGCGSLYDKGVQARRRYIDRHSFVDLLWREVAMKV